ncbi:hypothetical protein DWX43_23015 [Clostridium sp. AF19-22AC]|jgi:hypothetical protein|uniref:hypothetical protein n=1 Tax=Clostridia TaxID=186801 RepID=UPI000E5158C9|nr:MULTISPECIES: hypothetical protein [Clostridia]RHR21886.1 hypothetical protein DWX43_23015 [Clostridium sp. AF19-22AC]
MKGLLVQKRISGLINLVNAVFTFIIMIAYAVLSNKAGEFNKNVVIYLLLAVICCAVYFSVDHKFLDIANLVAVVFLTMGIGTFAIGSINTFADALNGISMFGSSGDIGYIVVLLILLAVALLAEIVSCFMSREPKVPSVKLTDKVSG